MTDHFDELLAAAPFPPLPEGWTLISAESLSHVTQETELQWFADGGSPTWGVALNPNLLPRTLTEDIVRRTKDRLSNRIAGIELLVGPTGEGKSTGLLQSLVALIREIPTLRVVWRRDSGARLLSDVIAWARDQTEPVVVASDNAQLLIAEIDRHVIGNDDLRSEGTQFLFASRDTAWVRAWRAAGFNVDPVVGWKGSSFLVVAEHGFNNLSDEDARRIVRSWDALGLMPAHLVTGSQADAAAALAMVSRSQTGPGALLGGLLNVRFGADGLRAHVADLLESLRHELLDSSVSLADVLAVVSLADIAELDGIPRELIADVCALDPSSLRVRVENRLAREAGASSDGDRLHGRHPRISEEVASVALSADSAISVESTAVKLIEATSARGRKSGFRPGYGQIFDMGRRIGRRSPSGMSPHTIYSLLESLNRAALSGQAHRLDAHVTLSAFYRKHSQASTAVDDVWGPIARSLLVADDWADWSTHARGAFFELATALSMAGHPDDAVLAAATGLSDLCEPEPVGWKLTSGIHVLSLSASRSFRDYPDPALETFIGETYDLLAGWPDPSPRYARIAAKESNVPPKSFPGAPDYVDHLEAALTAARRRPLVILGDAAWLRERDFVSLRSELSKREAVSVD